MSKEVRLSIPGLELAGLRWGAPDGLPVLAIHGWHDNAASFAMLAPLLKGVDLVAIDLPGHGHSARRPTAMHYHYTDYVADVLAAADALGWQQFTLLGHSLGAGIASLLAASQPERVHALVLIEGTGPLSEEADIAAAALQKALQQMSRHNAKAHKRRLYPDLQAAAEARRKGSDISQNAALTLADRGTENHKGGVRWRNDLRLDFRSPWYFSEAQVLALLEAIIQPVLLVIARDGLLQQRPATQERLKHIKNLHKEVLPGGHHLHMEQADQLAPLLNGFYQKHGHITR